MVAAASGKIDDAEGEFLAALSLSPDLLLAPGVSPKIALPFRSAKKRATKIDAQAKLDGEHLIVGVAGDVAGLVAEARITVLHPDRRSLSKKGKNTFMFSVPPSASVAVSLHDSWGNQVAVVASDRAPLVTAAKPRVERARSTGGKKSKSIIRRWWLWGGLAAVAAGNGTIFAVKTRSDQDRFDELAASGTAQFSELEEVEDRGKRNALISNFSFGVAGGLAVVGGIMFIIDSGNDSGEGASERSVLAPVLTADGAGLEATFHF